MCGIYGQWDVRGRPLDLGAVQSATTSLRHRGPDDEGYLLGDVAAGRYLAYGGPDTAATVGLPRLDRQGAVRADLALGFRRLAILDLSTAGHQPMAAPDGRSWIVFNGEVYNYRELRAELAAMGHTFRSGSDTEVVHAAYRAWGPDCLHRFNGMWAFAVWDSDTRTLFLARDRFGVKPLYYTWDGARFTFSSEIKALVGAHGIPFTPHDAAVYHYLHAGQLPSPHGAQTFFQGVTSLPPGHTLSLSGGRLDVRRFFRLPDAADPAPDARSAAEGYRELFTDAVRLRLRADVPIGSCLSGGVDSSSIVCVVNRLLVDDGASVEQIGERQRTFSAVYSGGGRYDESVHIERVLAATHAERNFTVPTVERLRAELPRLVWHQDEPFGSTSIFAQWCVMAAARARGVTVLLDGQGADEALAGYRPFDYFLADLLRGGRIRSALSAGRAIREITGLSSAPLLARALVRQLPAGRVEQLRRRRARTGHGAMRAEFANAHASAAPARTAASSLHENLRELFDETSLPHLLRYEDRNSMAFSVEGRVPFLDYRLVEYSLTRAHPWCIRDGWTKWILRESMTGIVPQEILWRRDKVGFETPERDWLNAWFDASPEGFEDTAPVARYLDLPAARREIAAWRAGRGDTRRVWRWLNVDLWLKAFAG